MRITRTAGIDSDSYCWPGPQGVGTKTRGGSAGCSYAWVGCAPKTVLVA